MSHSAAGLPQTHVWGMDFKSAQVTQLNDFQLTPSIVLNMEFLPMNRCAAHALPALSQALWCARRHGLRTLRQAESSGTRVGGCLGTVTVTRGARGLSHSHVFAHVV